MAIFNDKKIIHAWTMYDWANSTYNLLITSAIFPAYYSAIVPENINLFGSTFKKEAIASYSISIAFLLVALISPILSAMADYKGNKKKFMQFFCYMGSLACMALFFFKKDGTEVNTMYGVICSIFACIGFSGSIVFYNAYLPEIADKHHQDAVSAKGFAMGYIGSVILLVLSLVFILGNDKYHWINASLPARISFLLVGIWWAGFAQISFKYLQDYPTNKDYKHINIFKAGYGKLAEVWQQFAKDKNMVIYLLSFLFMTMGVQTIMYMATYFAASEIKMASSQLILVVLIIQLVAIVGAWFFAKISTAFSNKISLLIMLSMWVIVCWCAAFVVHTIVQFYMLAFVVGLIMGGTQSTTRSTYSKLLPPTTDTASFFSFYDVCEKIGIVIGTASFGFIADMMGGMRMSALGLAVYFLIGLLILLFFKSNKD